MALGTKEASLLHEPKVLPNDGSACKVVLTLLCGSLPIESNAVMLDEEITITIGNADNELSDNIEVQLQSMAPGELSQISLGNQSNTAPFSEKAESSEAVIIGVKLASFERQKDVWLLTEEEKLARAQFYKEKGVDLFKRGNIEMAFKKFSRALKYSILIAKQPPDNIIKECNTLKCQCYLNLGACQLQKENYSSVIDNCSKALCLDLNNVKGLYRRSQALCKLEDWGSAVEDLQKAKSIEPGNKAVSRLLLTAESTLQRQEEKMARAMKKMFVN